MSTDVISRPTLSRKAVASFILAISAGCVGLFTVTAALIIAAISVVVAVASLWDVLRSHGEKRGGLFAVEGPFLLETLRSRSAHAGNRL